MRIVQTAIFALLSLALGVPVIAQSSNTSGAPASMPARGPVRTSRKRPAREVPCWRKAGIIPERMNERWKINDDAKVTVGGVCNNSALTPQQKQDKIHQINQERDQEIARLIPAKDLESYQACLTHKNAARSPKSNEKELGPCGGLMPPSSASSIESHEHHDMPSSQ